MPATLKHKEVREENDGSGSVLFCDGRVSLPLDLFAERILDLLPDKRELVHRVSLVCQAWNAATRHPLLWRTALDAKVWKRHRERREGRRLIAMPPPVFPSPRHFVRFLRQRPQFAQIQALTPPDLIRTPPHDDDDDDDDDNDFVQLARACPHLEELDVTGSNSIRFDCLMPYNGHELLRLPELFPKLTRLRFGLGHDVERDHVPELARRMGQRLLELSVRLHEADRALDDGTLETIARHCPNLIRLEYRADLVLLAHHPSPLSERGPVALLQKCRRLQYLALPLSQAAFQRVERYAEEQDCLSYCLSSQGLVLSRLPSVDDERRQNHR